MAQACAVGAVSEQVRRSAQQGHLPGRRTWYAPGRRRPRSFARHPLRCGAGRVISSELSSSGVHDQGRCALALGEAGGQRRDVEVSDVERRHLVAETPRGVGR